MLNEEKQITVVDENGNEHLMQILFTYDNEERQTSYVFLYDEANPDDVFPMKYKFNKNSDGGDLEEITDPDEFAEVEEVFNAWQEDPKIQELKEEK